MSERDGQQGLVAAYNEAERALNLRWTSSARRAGQFVGGTVVVLSVLGGGIVALGMMTSAVLVGFAVAAIAMLPGAFMVLEWVRHAERSDALRQIMDKRKNYEALMLQMQTERQALLTEAADLRAHSEALRAVHYRALLATGSTLPGSEQEDDHGG